MPRMVTSTGPTPRPHASTIAARTPTTGVITVAHASRYCNRPDAGLAMARLGLEFISISDFVQRPLQIPAATGIPLDLPARRFHDGSRFEQPDIRDPQVVVF